MTSTDAQAPDTTATEEGFWVFFTSGHTIPLTEGHSAVYGYGMELLVTPEIERLSRDSAGRSALLERIERGDCGIQRGRWPEGVCRLLPNSLEWLDARSAAHHRAASLEDGDERRLALAEVNAYYGRRVTSKTLASYRA